MATQVKFYRGLLEKYTANASNYTDGIFFATDSEEIIVNGVHYSATKAQKEKLNGIAEGAEVNVIESVSVKHNGDTTASALAVVGTNVTIDLSTIELNVATLQSDLGALKGEGTGSVAEQIAAEASTRASEDAKLQAAIEAEAATARAAEKANADAISTLNGDASAAGSVANTVAAAVADETAARNAAIGEVQKDVNANTTAIAKLNGDSATEGSVAHSIAAETANRNAAVKTVQDQIDVIKGSGEGSITAGVNAAKTYADGLIEALDYTDNGTGALVTKVDETNGVIAVTHSDLASADKTVNIDGLDLSVNVDGTTIVKDASTGKLSVAQANLSKYVGENAIVVTGNDGEQKTISLKVKDGDLFLANDTNGVSTTISMSYDGGTKKIKLFGKDTTTAVSEIDATAFIKDGMLDKVELRESDDNLVFTFNTDSGKDEIAIPLTRFTDVYTGVNGVLVNGKEISAVVASEGNEYLSVGAEGLKVSGVDAAITSAVTEEKTRAEGVEKTLTDNLATEVARATTAENTIETSVGLSTDGAYVDTTKENALHKGATTVMGAIDKLDEAIRANNTAINTLNGDVNTVGSVAKAAADAEANANAYTDSALVWHEA